MISEDNYVNESIKSKIILNYISKNIFESMENNMKNGKTPFFNINDILKKLDYKEKQIFYSSLTYIYNKYTDYLYSILFNYYNMEDVDSGELRTLEDFKKKYELTKSYHCNKNTSKLFKILYKYIDENINFQNTN